MIDDNQQVLSSFNLSLPNKPKFKQPMSRKAKRLLEGMLGWSRPYHGQMWNGTPNFMEDFYPLYDPLMYEDVCHRFKVDGHLSSLKKAKAGYFPGTFKTKNDVLKVMQLCHLNNREWVKGSGLVDNPCRVGILSSERAHEVYSWLVANFIITDFSEEDLNKIAMFGDEKFSLDTIKREASKIIDVDKRTIPYLYAIVKDVSSREEYSRQKGEEIRSSQEGKMQAIIDFALESKNKLTHHFDTDMRDEWERSREFIDLMRNLKDKNE